jgi:hypothetical protein
VQASTKSYFGGVDAALAEGLATMTFPGILLQKDHHIPVRTFSSFFGCWNGFSLTCTFIDDSERLEAKEAHYRHQLRKDDLRDTTSARRQSMIGMVLYRRADVMVL